MQTHVVRGLGVLSLIGAGACGVGANVSGQLGATHTGDLTNPPAERGDGRLALTQACGEPSPTTMPYAFERTPYLQRVGAGSAELAWVSPADPDLSVVVSGIDGAVLASPSAAKDPSAALGTSAAQWLAPLAPLAPNTVYCYDVKTGTSVSERLGFRTAPAAGSGAPVRFIAFGDSGGGGDDQTALRDQMATVPFDFMLHTGDIPYDGGTRAAFEERFFGVYADYLKYFPVFPASGNHEYDSADAAPFREVFVLPENGGPDGIERWYSFD
jgi:hypothetical protein